MTDVIAQVERAFRDEDFARALQEAAAARGAWIDDELRRRWPLLAEVPERTRRLLSAVQDLLASTTREEAVAAAAIVEHEASVLATLRPTYVKVVASLAVLAPVELRVPASPPVEVRPT